MKTFLIPLAALASASLVLAVDKEKPRIPSQEGRPKLTPGASFKLRDANGDGKLTRAEFAKGAKNKALADKNFNLDDKDKDGFVSRGEFLDKGAVGIVTPCA